MAEYLHWTATRTRLFDGLLSLSSMPSVGVPVRGLPHIRAELLTNRTANSSRIRCPLPIHRRGHGEAIPLASEPSPCSSSRGPQDEAGRILRRVPFDSFTAII